MWKLIHTRLGILFSHLFFDGGGVPEACFSLLHLSPLALHFRWVWHTLLGKHIWNKNRWIAGCGHTQQQHCNILLWSAKLQCQLYNENVNPQANFKFSDITNSQQRSVAQLSLQYASIFRLLLKIAVFWEHSMWLHQFLCDNRRDRCMYFNLVNCL